MCVLYYKVVAVVAQYKCIFAIHLDVGASSIYKFSFAKSCSLGCIDLIRSRAQSFDYGVCVCECVCVYAFVWPIYNKFIVFLLIALQSFEYEVHLVRIAKFTQHIQR